MRVGVVRVMGDESGVSESGGGESGRACEIEIWPQSLR